MWGNRAANFPPLTRIPNPLALKPDGVTHDLQHINDLERSHATRHQTFLMCVWRLSGCVTIEISAENIPFLMREVWFLKTFGLFTFSRYLLPLNPFSVLFSSPPPLSQYWQWKYEEERKSARRTQMCMLVSFCMFHQLWGAAGVTVLLYPSLLKTTKYFCRNAFVCLWNGYYPIQMHTKSKRTSESG